MMWTRSLGTFALCLLLAGCHLVKNAAQNATYEAKLATDESKERCQYEKLAEETWASEQGAESPKFSKTYFEGFKDGFVDYLQFGGSGQPPYLPPKRFWTSHYRTPEGFQEIENWYAGFRHGVASAQRSGLRKWATLPNAYVTEQPLTVPHPPTVLPLPSVYPTMEGTTDVKPLPPELIGPPTPAPTGPKIPSDADTLKPPTPGHSATSVPVLMAPVAEAEPTRVVPEPAGITLGLPLAAPEAP